jgi:hypothetical protein
MSFTLGLALTGLSVGLVEPEALSAAFRSLALAGIAGRISRTLSAVLGVEEVDNAVFPVVPADSLS